MKTCVKHHQALEELTLLSHCHEESVADRVQLILAVWAQYQEGGIEMTDLVSIVQRSLVGLQSLPQSQSRELAIRALENLL